MKRKELKVKKFLREMDVVVPWKSLVEAIKPHYKSTLGRAPYPLELMLRIHFFAPLAQFKRPSNGRSDL